MEMVNSAFIAEEKLENVQENMSKVPGSKFKEMIPAPALDYSTARKISQIAAAQAATLSGFLLGTSFGWPSPVQPQLQQQSLLNAGENGTYWEVHLDDDQMSWVGSLLNVGAIFGAIMGGFLMDKFGRRFTMMVMSVPFIVGWLITSLALNSIMFYIGRIVVGYAGGVCSAIAYCYVGEISTPPMRGIVGFFFSANLTGGLLVTSLMGLNMNWRSISAVCTVEPILFFISLLLVPESPYFLVKHGRSTEALKALKWLRGSNYDIKAELQQIANVVENDMKETTRVTDLFQPSVYKPCLIGILLMIFQQFSGMNAVLFNAAEIFRVVDPNFDQLVGVVLINVVQVVAVVGSFLLVERLNRRTLFILAEGLACFSIVLLGVFFYYSTEESHGVITSFKWIPLTTMVLFFSAMGMGVGPLPWLISSEVLPAKFRGPGSSIYTFTNYAMAFIVTKTFVDMERQLTHAGVFWFYGGISFLGILFGLFVLPETKNRTPDQIRHSLLGSNVKALS